MKKRQKVYDLYWYFACERQNIFLKKLNGESAPWTDDKILQEYKFCNSYRINDRVSQYLLKNVIYNGKNYFDEDMLFRILLFKLFNKESTWELLLNNFGDITLKTFNIKEYSKEGSPIHLIDTKGLELETFDSILNDLLQEIDKRKNTTDSTNYIHIAWYCINYNSKRIEDGELNIIKKLSSEIPVIAIVSKIILR